MLCLIVAYKSHRSRDQWLESFVWGRPLVTTSVKIAGAQHRHLRRGAAVSATTGRVGNGSLSNGSCARICGNQSDFLRSQQKRNMESKKHANNHEQIKGASYTLIEWVCPSGCWRCLCADFVSMRGTQRVWRIHLPRLRWLALCWLLAQWPVPVTCETGIPLGYWPWCHRLRLQHSRRKRSLYVLVTLRISLGMPTKFDQLGIKWSEPCLYSDASFLICCPQSGVIFLAMIPAVYPLNSPLTPETCLLDVDDSPASSYAVLNLVWYFWQWFQLCILWTHLWPPKPASLMLMTAPCKDRHPVKWNLLKSRLPSTP